MPFDKTITTRDKWQVPRTLGDETLKPVTKIDDSRFNTGDSNRLLSVSPGETGTVEGINQTQTVQGGNMTYQPTEDGSGQENELIDKSQDVETLGTDEVVVQTPTMNFISGETGTDGTGSTDGSTTLFDDSSGDQTGQADGDP